MNRINIKFLMVILLSCKVNSLHPKYNIIRNINRHTVKDNLILDESLYPMKISNHQEKTQRMFDLHDSLVNTNPKKLVLESIGAVSRITAQRSIEQYSALKSKSIKMATEVIRPNKLS